MKNLIYSIKITPVALAAILATLIGILWLVTLLEYTLHMSNFVAVPASIVISVAVISLTTQGVRKRKEHATGIRILCAISPLLAIFFIVGITLATSMHLVIYPLLFMVILICSMDLFFFCTRSLIVKIVLGIIYSLVVLLICLFLILFAYFAIMVTAAGGFSSNEAVQSEFSPHGTHLAEVVSSNQGALGGATFIDITRQRRNLNLFVVALRRNHVRVYSGRFGEAYSMKLYWESDTVLRVYFRDDVMVFTRMRNRWVQS